MYTGDGVKLAQGYSGSPDAKNDPAKQTIHQHGPIPMGIYTISAPEFTETHGPYVLPLTPDPANEMFGRAGFLIHGDSIKDPGTASEGCIILPRFARERIWESGERGLVVVDSVATIQDPEVSV
jgi:hypothetical protein